MRSDSEERLALAAAEAVGGKSRAYRIGPDNRRHPGRGGDGVEPSVALVDAVRDDNAFYVKVAAGVLAVDFDGEGAEAAATALYLDLRLAGLLPVLCASGGRVAGDPSQRRCHVFARLGGPTDASVVDRALTASGGDVRRTIRPPYAAHRSGTSRSTPILPADPTEVVARLTSARAPAALDDSQVSRWIQEEIVERGRRSDAILQVASRLAASGWSLQEALLLLHDERFAIGQTYRSRLADRSHAGDAWFTTHVWPAAVDYAAKHPDTPPQLEIVRRTYRAAVRRGRTRVTDLKVMGVLLDLAATRRSTVVSISTRQLREVAGVASQQTLSRSLRRLKEVGLLRAMPKATRRWRKPLPEGVVGHPMLYELLAPATSTGEPVAAEGVVPRSFAGTAAFRIGTGLGATAGLVFDELNRCGTALSVAAVAEALGLSQQSVRRALGRLDGAGLASRAADGWTTTGVAPRDVTPADAAHAAAAQRQRHELEREAWRVQQNPSAGDVVQVRPRTRVRLKVTHSETHPPGG